MATNETSQVATLNSEVEQILNPFKLSREQLMLVMSRMRKEMEMGLKGQKEASVRMLPTFVLSRPNGEEKGNFLALDLGGTNFRVLLVTFGTQTEDKMKLVIQTSSIPKEMMQGSENQLFDHLVGCVAQFLSKHKITERLRVGFTFSFPCEQTRLDKAILISWTKGFKIPGCVGKDVVQLLREAIQRRQDLDLEVVAITNDTVGTMMSAAFQDRKCEIGLIVGTGTNACYMELMKNIEKLDGDTGEMCINMEWGAFGEGELHSLADIVNEFDKRVDEQSLHPGKQIFEKMISGKFLGAIVQTILLKLKEKGCIFQEIQIAILNQQELIKTDFMSQIESGDFQCLKDLGLPCGTEDCDVVQAVCQAVSQRAAQLCGAGLAAVLERMRENHQVDHLEITVGVDGTLYKSHPHFSQILSDTVRDLAAKCEVRFQQSKDSSGVGAALVAASTCVDPQHHEQI